MEMEAKSLLEVTWLKELTVSLVLDSALLITTQPSWFLFLFLERKVCSSNIYWVSAWGGVLGGMCLPLGVDRHVNKLFFNARGAIIEA